LEQYACGEMGFDINYLYSLTPREYENILVGKLKKQDLLLQNSWEQIRTVVYYNYLLQPTEGSKKTATEILPLHWDAVGVIDTKQPKPRTAKELEAVFYKNKEKTKQELSENPLKSRN